jgi:L-rhamnose mutarotase
VVLKKQSEDKIRNYSIFLKHDVLFGYFEYHGANRAVVRARMSADVGTREWWSIMELLQDPIGTRKEGDWWVEMEQIFHRD